jgi:Ca2+-dependent lipid-binding protein
VKYIGDDIEIICLDEDLTKSDEIGRCTVKTSAMCVNGGLDDWYELNYKGKKSGAVHIKSQWFPAMSQQVAFSANTLGAFMSGAMDPHQQAMQHAPMGYAMSGAMPQQ